VANPERDRGKGLGMGLAIVKRLAHLLGHTVAVRSLPGKGSVFRIWAKASEQTALDDFALAAETVPGALDASRTVLVLDDEESIRTSVAQLLAEWGYEVLTAATTDEGLERLAALEGRGGTLDCVVTDLRLRDGDDGIAAIDRLREAAGFAVPALLVTGDTAPEQMLRVHASGHIALWKPVQPAELLNVLKRLLR
jgi:CheY-like chemotaxis protein